MATGRNYVRQGDAFSDLVRRGEGPPTVIHWLNRNTGRDYYTRVPVHRCTAVRASDAAAALGARLRHFHAQHPELNDLTLLDLAEKSELRVDLDARTSALRVADHSPVPPATVQIKFTVSQTGNMDARGVRVWLICPRCSRRCGVVYASRWDAQGWRLPGLPGFVTGCRVCLGLTDQSRQRHKTLDWASAVLGQRTYSEGKDGLYQQRGWGSRDRAYDLYMASFARVFGSLGIPMPGAE